MKLNNLFAFLPLILFILLHGRIQNIALCWLIPVKAEMSTLRTGSLSDHLEIICKAEEV